MADVQSLFGIALGSSVALANLTYLSPWLFNYNRVTSGSPRKRVAITAPALNEFPVEQRLESGGAALGGNVDHEWNILMTAAAYSQYRTTFFASGATTFAAVTINTPVQQLDVFTRYNATAIQPHGEDLVYIRGHLLRVRQRFQNLVAA